MDLVSWTFDSAVSDKDAPLLIDPSDTARSLSYNQIRSCVRKLVAGFRAVGIQQGDCVLVNSFNDILYNALYLGIMGAGAVFTGVNPSYTTHELIHHMRLTKPKILIVEPKLLDKVLEAADEIGLSRTSIFLFNIHSDGEGADIQSWETLLQHGEEDWTTVSDPSQTVAHYASTSGTSGLPKAAMLPHSYHVSQAAARLTGDTLPYTPRRLTALPPFHVFATPIVPSAIRQGVPTYVMRRFEMKSFISAVEEFGISELYTPPTVLLGMAQSPYCTKEALKSVRQVWFGGARVLYGCQIPLYEMLHDDAKIQPVWGMTEAGWITEGLWHEKHTDDSSGRLLSVFDVKIVDDDDNILTHEGDEGEILVKSPHMMLGYIGNSSATKEAFDSDGWLRTGDVGHVHNGKIFVVDRKKDLIKVRGWQVSPAEVEGKIMQHPSILDAAVIGIELANKTGELGRAYIVARPGTQLTEADIRNFIKKDLANYKIPDEYVFTDSIPKNPTGKILRRQLREEASKADGGKPVPTKESVLEGTASGPWRYARRASKTAELASRDGEVYHEDMIWYDSEREQELDGKKDEAYAEKDYDKYYEENKMYDEMKTGRNNDGERR